MSKHMVKIPLPDVYYGHWHGDELRGTECITFPLELTAGTDYMIISVDPESDMYQELKMRGMVMEEETISDEEYLNQKLAAKELIHALNAEPN